MKRVFATWRGLFIALGFVAGVAPVQAQLTGIVNYAVPVGGEAPATHLVGEYGRGLNEDSGKLNAFALAAGRTGVGGRGSVFVGASMLDAPLESIYSFGVVGAVGVMQPTDPTQVSVQAGIGYSSPADGVTNWSVPVGIALQRSMPQASGAASKLQTRAGTASGRNAPAWHNPSTCSIGGRTFGRPVWKRMPLKYISRRGNATVSVR